MQNKFFALFLIAVLMLGGVSAVMAQEDTSESELPPVIVDVTGVVVSFDTTTGLVTLEGGVFVVVAVDNPDFLVEVGMEFTFSGELGDDGTLVADTVVSADDAEDEGEETDADDADDADDEGEETDEVCGFEGEEGEEGTTDEGTTEEGDAEEGDGGCHPVLEVLSDAFEVPYDELQDLRDEGYGIGEIARAYLLAEAAGVDVSEITDLRDSGMGWGQIMKEYPDVHPSDLAPGSVIGNGKGKTIHELEEGQSVREGKGKGKGKGNKGNGNGNGKGKGGGNGNGNGGGKP